MIRMDLYQHLHLLRDWILHKHEANVRQLVQ